MKIVLFLVIGIAAWHVGTMLPSGIALLLGALLLVAGALWPILRLLFTREAVAAFLGGFLGGSLGARRR